MQSLGDRPIEGRAGDALGRCAFAEQIALEITAAPGDSGFVVAVTGPWGSGKTSVINKGIGSPRTRASSTSSRTAMCGAR